MGRKWLSPSCLLDHHHSVNVTPAALRHSLHHTFIFSLAGCPPPCCHLHFGSAAEKTHQLTPPKKKKLCRKKLTHKTFQFDTTIFGVGDVALTQGVATTGNNKYNKRFMIHDGQRGNQNIPSSLLRISHTHPKSCKQV